MTGTRKSESPRSRRQEAPATRAIAVCGGAGFLGSHLVRRLLREGHRVVCVDNFCTSDEDAVEDLLDHPRFELQRRDVAELGLDDLGDVGAIYNLACAASPPLYQRDPLGTLRTSIRGMENLLQIARRTGAKVFQASTSEIYGHPTVHPQPETYWGHVNTLGPRACYDEGKRCAETLCFIYHHHYGVPVRIARIFNTYGPRMNLGDGRVVINFIVQALGNQPLTVYGDGQQTRSFCYVDDLVDGIQKLMAPAVEYSGPVNLGNPAEFTVRELAERIVRLTNSSSTIVTRPLPVDDPPRRRPDVTLAREVLGWQPSTDLDAGLRLTIEDTERRLALGDAALLGLQAELAGRSGGLAGANVA